MRSRKIDYKNKTDYKNGKNSDNKKCIIIRYAIYLLIILIISFIISFWISSDKDEEPEIVDVNDSLSEENINTTLLVNEFSLPNNNEQYTNVMSYHILIYNSKNIQINTIPAYTRFNQEDFFTKRIFDDSQYYDLIENWNKTLPDIKIDEILVVSADKLIDDADFSFFDYDENKLIEVKPFNIDGYDYLYDIDIDYDIGKIYNHFVYQNLIMKIIINKGLIKKPVIRINERFGNGSIFDILKNNVNMSYGLNPVIINNDNELILDKTNLDKNLNIIQDKNHIEFIPKNIKVSVRNATEHPFKIGSIIRELKKYNIEVIDYKNTNIKEDSFILNYSPSIFNISVISSILGDIDYYGCVFDIEKDYDMILYIGSDYNRYFDFEYD